MASYYFAPAPEGKSTNAGTSASVPLDYPGSFKGKTFVAGDQVFLKSGYNYPGPMYFSTALGAGIDVAMTGTAGNPVKFDIYGGSARATVVSPPTAAWVDGWQFMDVAAVEVRNIDFAGANNGGGYGLSFYATKDVAVTYDHITFQNVTATGYSDGIALYTYGMVQPKLQNVVFDNCITHHNIADGIMCTGNPSVAQAATFTNVNITNCVSHHNGGDRTVTGYNTGNGIMLGQATSSTIDRCVAYENGGSDAGPTGPVGIWFWNCTNSTIQRCVSYKNHRGANVAYDGNGIGVDVDSSNCTVQYNLAWGNDGYGFYCFNDVNSTGTNSTFRFNISFANCVRPVANNMGEMLLGGHLSGTKVYNNTFIASGANANQPALIATQTSFGSTYANVRIANNIFATLANSAPTVMTNDTRLTTEILLQNNLYWRPDGSAAIKWGGSTYTTLAAFRTGAGATQEQVSGANVGFVQDPKLSPLTLWADPSNVETCEAARLPGTSALAAAGIDINTVLGASPSTRDFSGKTLRAVGSIGAQQEPLLTLNTAQNPNLSQVLISTDDGVLDFAAQKVGSTVPATGRERDQVRAVRNGSGQPYFVET